MNRARQGVRVVVRKLRGRSWLAGLAGTGLLIAACSSEEAPRERIARSEEAISPATVSFQNGVAPTAAYLGSTDATLRQGQPTTNTGNDSTCLVDGDDGGSDLYCLFRWTLSGVPAGSTIQNASLTLTVTNATGNTYNIYALRRPWTEAQATWNQARTSDAWATPGAQGELDRDATVIGTVTASATGLVTVPLNAAGVTAVQAWVNDAANYGIVVGHPTNTDGLDIASSEHATQSSRPRLTVTYLPAEGATDFVALGSTWRYLDNGSDQGSAWGAPSFDDSSWKAGPAELGYGDGDEATLIASGPAGAFHITSYFRRPFTVEDPARVSNLTLDLERDDGAVVYLNGTELYRNNMPAGAVTYTTRASSTVDGAPLVSTPVPSAALVAGTNVLAVEVHQVSTSSSDVSFDARLSGTVSSTTAVPKQTLSFTPVPGDVMNPERGWFDWIHIDSDTNFTSTRSEGKTLSYAPVILPNVATLPASLFTSLNAGLNGVRNAGLKVILRLYYHEVHPTDGSLDPDVSRILSHIDQIGTSQLLTTHADVIAAIQAGFIGPWGEFHSSRHLPPSTAWKQVIDRLWTIVPSSRMVQFRTPKFKHDYFHASEHGPLLESEAFTGTRVARSGHFNDCFLMDATDGGTYWADEDQTVDEWKYFVQQDSRFTPVGGQTCYGSQRADCTTAIAELGRFHWSFIDETWWGPIVNPPGHPEPGTWAQPDDPQKPECWSEITRRLGYRFVLEQAQVSQAVRPGDVLELDVRLRNDGFASPFNERFTHVVLKGTGGTYVAQLTGSDVDPRRWAAGEVRTFTRRLLVPSTVVPGTYTLALWLPDAAPTLRMNTNYAVRFANTTEWDAPGHNVLTRQFQVSTTAAPNQGASDGAFTQQQ